MRKILSKLIVLPVLILSIIFLVANRQMVMIGLDPFSTEAPAVAIGPMPLWVALIGALLVGYVIGAGAVWRAGIARRRKAKDRHKELKALKREMTLITPLPDGPEEEKRGVKRLMLLLPSRARRNHAPELK